MEEKIREFMNSDEEKALLTTDEALEDAHRDYIRRRNEILTKLETMKAIPTLLSHERLWLNQVIEFIKEKEI